MQLQGSDNAESSSRSSCVAGKLVAAGTGSTAAAEEAVSQSRASSRIRVNKFNKLLSESLVRLGRGTARALVPCANRRCTRCKCVDVYIIPAQPTTVCAHARACAQQHKLMRACQSATAMLTRKRVCPVLCVGLCAQIDLDALRELSWSGIPQELRPTCWKLLLGYLPPNKYACTHAALVVVAAQLDARSSTQPAGPGPVFQSYRHTG